MLSKPLNGRCLFSMFDLKIQMNCVTDIPFDRLKTCRFGLENSAAVSLVLTDHGNEYIVLLLALEGSLILKDIEGKRSVEECKTNLKDFTEHLLMDIENDLEGWVNWYPAKILREQDAGRKQALQTLLADTAEGLVNFKKKRKRG